jgi:hypothetical protein
MPEAVLDEIERERETFELAGGRPALVPDDR